VGMPATISAGSDCYPATVVRVYRNGKAIDVQMDAWSVAGGEWPDHDYEYSRNPEGSITTYTLRKNGRWKMKGWPLRSRGGSIGLGHRRHYYDPHF